jgi:RNA polymerase sigma factor (sigma-70 family)
MPPLHAAGARPRTPSSSCRAAAGADDQRLLALFRGGDEEAFAALHDRYRPRLLAYVQRRLRAAATRSDAEDVVQDVFVRAYYALRRDERDVHMRAWLFTVTHNRCLDYLARRAPRPAELLDVPRAPVHDPVEEAHRREHLRCLVCDIQRLPDRQRHALVMRELDGMSHVQLAERLEATIPAVKSLLARARVELTQVAAQREFAAAPA